MSEVPRLGHGAADRRLAVIEQGIEVIDQWLDLRHVPALDARIATLMDRAEPRTQLADAGNTSPHLEHAGDHEQQGDEQRGYGVKDPAVHGAGSTEERQV